VTFVISQILKSFVEFIASRLVAHIDTSVSKKTISDIQTLSHDQDADLSLQLLNCQNTVVRKRMPNETIHYLATTKLCLALLRR
jgi:hypothetical protein